MFDPAALGDLGRNPIPGDSPAGQDVRLSDDYSRIQAEIDKLTAILGPGEGVDWEAVADLAGGILAGKSKDLTVAAYLCVALQETGQVPVLAAAASFLADLLENFWDGLFPALARLRARRNALDWWRARTSVWLGRNRAPIDGTQSAEIGESLRRLDAVLARRELPSLSELIGLARQVPLVPPPVTAPAPGPESAEGAGAPPKKDAPAPPRDLGEAREALSGTAAAFIEMAGDALWADPWYWKVSRLVLWGGVSAPPPAEGNATQLPAPSTEELGGLGALLAAGSFRQALAGAEDLARLHVFGLDLQRISFEALRGMGLGDAAAAVLSEASFLAARFPLLPSLSFSDGSPLASEGTRAWLKGPGAAQAEAGGASVDQKGLGDLAKGDPAQALVRLSQAGHRPRDGRSLLVSRAAEARLWNSLGHRAKAVGLADFLVAQVEDRGLADWEPDLAVLALKAAFDAYHSAGPASAAKARRAAVLLALASPAEALALPPTDPEG